MKFRSLIVGSAILVSSVLGGGAGMASAGTVHADSSPTATWSYWWARLQYRIVGTGSYVNYFAMNATNETWPGTLYVSRRVVGPNGFATPWTLFGIPLANTVNMSIGENRNLATGTYCGQYDIYGKAVTQECYSVL